MQEVKIYNSLNNKIEVFKPIEEGKVSIYVCGPTVYGNLHIGNARPIAVFDIFVKALRKMGYEEFVKHTYSKHKSYYLVEETENIYRYDKSAKKKELVRLSALNALDKLRKSRTK